MEDNEVSAFALSHSPEHGIYVCRVVPSDGTWAPCNKTANLLKCNLHLLEYKEGAVNRKYLATAKKANSTFNPLLADVSINATLYSLESLSPSSLLTARSDPQSALLPVKENSCNNFYAYLRQQKKTKMCAMYHRNVESSVSSGFTNTAGKKKI